MNNFQQILNVKKTGLHTLLIIESVSAETSSAVRRPDFFSLSLKSVGLNMQLNQISCILVTFPYAVCRGIVLIWCGMNMQPPLSNLSDGRRQTIKATADCFSQLANGCYLPSVDESNRAEQRWGRAIIRQLAELGWKAQRAGSAGDSLADSNDGRTGLGISRQNMAVSSVINSGIGFLVLGER